MMAMIFMLSVEDGCGRGASVEEWKVFYAIPMWIRENSDDSIFPGHVAGEYDMKRIHKSPLCNE